jgi:hypothetical protein
LTFSGGTYYVRVVVPADVRDKLGKREFIESLKTGDRRDAERFYPEVFRRFKIAIATARSATNRSRLPIGNLKVALGKGSGEGCSRKTSLWRKRCPHLCLHRRLYRFGNSSMIGGPARR